MVNEKIVLSIPGNHSQEFFQILNRQNRQNIDFLLLNEIILELIVDAMQTIDIIAPFQININDKILDEINKSIKRGVKVRIITRYSLDDDAPFQSEPLRMHSRYFDTNNGNSGSVHAKMVISDKIRAYVGSGELMNTSLYKNLEIGLLIVEELNINMLSEIFNAAWEIAEPYC